MKKLKKKSYKNLPFVLRIKILSYKELKFSWSFDFLRCFGYFKEDRFRHIYLVRKTLYINSIHTKFRIPNRVKYLSVWSCSNFEKVPDGVKFLSVWNCPKFEKVPDGVEGLHVMGCPKFEKVPDGVKHLKVSFCPKFEKAPDGVESLEVSFCPKFEKIPDGVVHS